MDKSEGNIVMTVGYETIAKILLNRNSDALLTSPDRHGSLPSETTYRLR
jgi:hypothetical protein